MGLMPAGGADREPVMHEAGIGLNQGFLTALLGGSIRVQSAVMAPRPKPVLS